MPDFEQGDVVRVPFPYTDRATRQHRPALVVSDGEIGDGNGLLWVAMITSAANRRWQDDLSVDDLVEAGLPSASVIRTCKIATIEASHAERLGKVTPAVMKSVTETIGRYAGIA
jgi:mRNA interferase MazF